MHNPTILNIQSLKEARQIIKDVGSDPQSINIMAPKAILKVIKLENVVLQDAIIIKQDMLSIGGEVAVPKDAFQLKEKTADILVMGTLKQLQELTGKLCRHYPRIKTIGKELAQIVKEIQ